MNKRINILHNSLISTFIYVFIVVYFLFLLSLIKTLYPYNIEIPIFLFIGFALIIVVIFYFFIKIVPNEKCNETIINFKVINENSIKFILILLMCIFIFIPPITFTKTVMAWTQIGFLNYIRAIVVLIGCAFLPGACIFNIFFPKSTLHERFKIEPFLLKITIYPLLSFTFLGTSTLILDQLGLLENYFCLCLFLIILALLLCDFLIQICKKNAKMLFECSKINISNFTFSILLLAISVIMISLGIVLNTKYPLVPDDWGAIQYTNYIGHLDRDPTIGYWNYALYWGYITFSLGALSGIPFINNNFMLFPFIYLIVTSSYLFMKALLINFKEIYALLATIFLITFSGLFYVINTFHFIIQNSFFHLNGVLYFNYKSIPIYLVLASLALFLIINRTNKELKTKSIVLSENFLITVLGAWFLIQSIMIYFLTFFPAISFVFIYSLSKINEKRKFKQYFIFWYIFVALFFLFDILTDFYFSTICIGRIFNFLEESVPSFKTYFFLYVTLFYLTLFSSVFLIYFGFKICIKIVSNRKINQLKLKFNPRIIFLFILIIFTSLLVIYVSLNNLKKINDNFFAFYLDLVFFNVGFIGLLAIYLSYFCYKKNKNLFFILWIWFLFLFGLASVLIFLRWLEYPFLALQNIPESHYYFMMYWFDRNWSYSIVPLSILSSIGIIEFKRFLKSKKLFKLRKKNFKLRFKLISTSFIIFFSLSNTIISGIFWSNLKSAFSENEAQIIGWISENIPKGSNILIDRGGEITFKRYLEQTTFGKVYFIDLEVDEALSKDGNENSLVKQLKLKQIYYYIYSKENTPKKEYVEKYFDIENELIPTFYKIKLYEYKNLILYSTKDV